MITGHNEQVAYWFSLASQDAVASMAAHILRQFPYDIRFRRWGRMHYEPQSLGGMERGQIDDVLRAVLLDYTPAFQFISGGHLAVNTHIFFHELTHFYQDTLGFMLTPVVITGEQTIWLDEQSDVRLTLFLEAWAETEAIRLSWVCKENGDETAWKGALKHADWSYLAKQYQSFREGGETEDVACVRVMQSWYEGKHRVFYERRASRLYTRFLKHCERGGGEVRFKTLPSVVVSSLLRQADVPSYIALLDRTLLDGMWGYPLKQNYHAVDQVLDIAHFSHGSLAYLAARESGLE